MRKYPTYKDSGIEWIGKIPKNWELKPLKHSVSINRDVLPEITAQDYELQYIDIGNVDISGLISPPDTMIFEDAPSRARRVINNGDTIVSTVRTYLKAIAFIDSNENNLIASTGFAILSPNGLLNSKYIYYIISSQKVIDTISSLSVGVSYPAITASELGRIPMWFPKDIAEQQAIADYLDKKTGLIDELISKKRRQIELLTEQRQGVINQAVTKGLDPNVEMKDSGIEWLGEIPKHWEIPKFKFTCSLIKDGTHLPPLRQKEGIPLLSVRNMVKGKFINLPDDSLISENDYHNLTKTFRVEQYDVLLAIVGATLGKVAIVEKMNRFAIQRSIAVFRTIPDILDYKYLAYFMRSEVYQKLLWQNVGFSAQPGIYLSDLSNFNLTVPPLSEQINIVSKVEHLESELFNAISKAEQQIELLQEYRTALISEAVTGKIKVG